MPDDIANRAADEEFLDGERVIVRAHEPDSYEEIEPRLPQDALDEGTLLEEAGAAAPEADGHAPQPAAAHDVFEQEAETEIEAEDQNEDLEARADDAHTEEVDAEAEDLEVQAEQMDAQAEDLEAQTEEVDAQADEVAEEIDGQAEEAYEGEPAAPTEPAQAAPGAGTIQAEDAEADDVADAEVAEQTAPEAVEASEDEADRVDEEHDMRAEAVDDATAGRPDGSLDVFAADFAPVELPDGDAAAAEMAAVDAVAVPDAEPVSGVVEPEPVAEPARDGLLPDGAGDDLRQRWQQVLLHFVDDPRGAAGQARALADEAVRALTAALAEHQRDLDSWADAEDGGTEEYRIAVQQYRRFVDRVLRS